MCLACFKLWLLTSYLETRFDPESIEIAEHIDDMSYWSVSTGNLLLSLIKTAHYKRVLDVACGTGFPLLTLSQRFGPTCQLYGQDEWQAAIESTRKRIQARNIQNVELQQSSLAQLRIKAHSIDLVTAHMAWDYSTDTQDLITTCKRLLRPGGELVMATQLQGTLEEFYQCFEACLLELQLKDSISRFKKHLKHYQSIESLSQGFMEKGLSLELAITDTTYMYYADGTSFLNDYFVQMQLMPAWKALVPTSRHEAFFSLLEKQLNEMSAWDEELKLVVPIAALKFSV